MVPRWNRSIIYVSKSAFRNNTQSQTDPSFAIRNYSKVSATTASTMEASVEGFLGKPEVVSKSFLVGRSSVATNWIKKDLVIPEGIPLLSQGRQRRELTAGLPALCRCSQTCGMHHMLPFARSLATSSASQSSGRTPQERHGKDISTVDDPFDAPTYNIPEKPVTFAEGASYSVVILAGLGIAAAAGYAVFKELIFEPKEYKIFGKALERIQNDSQGAFINNHTRLMSCDKPSYDVSLATFLGNNLISIPFLHLSSTVRVRIGSPITGYGQESRNRAARQRIPNRTWTDEDGVERVEVNFYIRGPHGAGKVYTEMFKDKEEKQWKFTYLIVEIKSPTPAQLMLESYVPALESNR
ncbi:hypothetical protein Scep_026708 [Stephania cephalantha]|uniref:Mitochondrial import inner membrane translocase subunit Tim21 n=2 Tax=Magnoliopsida TaxID=3398 RepID=A0AAP0EL35_9MAGN